MRMIAATIGSKIFARGRRCEKIHVGEYRELNFAVEAINIAYMCSRPHANIVPYSIVGAFIITAPLYPSTLATHKVTTIDELRQYVMQIGGALRHMHDSGILHRDVKPDNIFCAPPNYFLGDLGSAKLIVERPCNTDGRTTRAYMAPELIRDGRYSVATDIWAFGVTIFYLQHDRAFDYRKFDTYESAAKYLTSTVAFDDTPNTGNYATNRYLCWSPENRMTGIWSDYKDPDVALMQSRTQVIVNALKRAVPTDVDYFLALYFDEPIEKNNVNHSALSRLQM